MAAAQVPTIAFTLRIPVTTARKIKAAARKKDITPGREATDALVKLYDK